MGDAVSSLCYSKGTWLGNGEKELGRVFDVRT